MTNIEPSTSKRLRRPNDHESPPIPGGARHRLIHAGFVFLVCAWVVGSASGARAQGEASSPNPAVSDVASSSASETGALVERISLALPAAPLGLPVPLTIRSASASTRDVLGPGWQVPLSYVRMSLAIDGQVPVAGGAFERIELSIAGSTSSLRASEVQGSFIKYRPLVGNHVLELVFDKKERVFRAHTTSAQVYVFRQLEDVYDEELWLLTEILDGTGTHRITVEYTADLLPGGEDGPDAQEVVIHRIRYGFAPGTECPKFTVLLHYARTGVHLDLTVRDGMLWTHSRLLTEVQVIGSADTACTDQRVIGGHYFHYEADPHVDQSRLRAVTRYGLDTEGLLPQAVYTYGNYGEKGVLYGASRNWQLPPSTPAWLKNSISVVSDEETPFHQQTSLLRDFTGDGQPDFVFTHAGEHDDARDVRLSAQSINTAGTRQLNSTVTDLFPADGSDRLFIDGGDLIDWNGDGRLDVIRHAGHAASHEPSWDVYINTPSANSPNGLTWRSLRINPARLPNVWYSTPGEQGPSDGDDDGDGQPDGPQDGWAYASFGPTQSAVAYDRNRERCYQYLWNQSAARFERTGCPGFATDGTRDRTTSWAVTMWALRDVNADGYPDFVYNSERPGVELKSRDPGLDVACPASVTSMAQVPEACTRICNDHKRVDLPSGNYVGVIYHTGIQMARPGQSIDFGGPQGILRKSAPCGFERRKRSGPSSGLESHLVCGLRDVNGDGLLDWIDQSNTSVKQAHIELGTGRPAWGFNDERDHFLPVALRLPGKLELDYDEHARCFEGHGGKYRVSRRSELADITGDSIPDYVYYGDQGGPLVHDAPDAGWWFHEGLGHAFGPPQPLDVEGAGPDFALREDDAYCGGSRFTKAWLTDIDGNGRLDVVTATGGGSWSVRSPVDVLDDQSSVLGVGRLRTIDNGYGVVRTVQYASAKDDPYTAHTTPTPEVVVSRVDTTVSDALQGEAPASEHFAYGQSHMFYHAAARRFASTGFLRRVRARLRPSKRHKGDDVATAYEGFAVVEDSHSPDGFEGFERAAVGGFPRHSYKLAGVFATASAWPLMNTLWVDDRSYAGSDTKWGAVVHTPAPQGHTDFAEAHQGACADVTDPFAPYTPPTASELALCHQYGFLYPAIETSWEGDRAPQLSDENLQRRKRIEKADALGRPLFLRNEGDIFEPSDDLCEELSYATPVAQQFETTHNLSAVAYRSQTDCKSLVLLRESMAYDGLDWSKVQAGHRTRHFIEVHRADTGALSASYDLATIELNERGLPRTVVVPHVGEESSSTHRTVYEYDAFGLVPTRVLSRASDVAVSFEKVWGYDLHRLLPIRESTIDGVSYATAHDAHGRISTRWMELEGQAYFLDAVEYLGESPGDPLGERARTIEATTYLPWQPGEPLTGLEGLEGVVTHTTYFDRLGRKRFTRQPMGGDYANGELQADYTTYDAFGRPVFAASTGTSSENSLTAYGSTQHYDLRGRSACLILGEGPQVLTGVPDPDRDTYPTCWTYDYEGHRAFTTQRGPLELASSGPASGATDVSVATGTGRIVENYRVHAGSRVEWSRYGYDALGNLQRVERAADPNSPSTAFVGWTTLHDGLGRVLEVREPGAATVSHLYNSDHQVVRTAWTETLPSGAREHVLRQRFDGHQRLTLEVAAVRDVTTGTWTAESASRYQHDAPCASDVHTEADHLRGREACVITVNSGADGGLAGQRTIYHAYDALGRLSRTTRRDSAGETVQESFEYDLSRMRAVNYKLPDTSDIERVEYEHDSAARLRAAHYVRGSASELVYDIVDRDVLGHVNQVRLGNGVTEEFGYRPDRRQELLHHQVSGPGFSFQTANIGYDALGRTVAEISSGPDSQTFRSRVLTYDVNHHLAEVSEHTGLFAPVETYAERFIYDGLGNLTVKANLLTGASTSFARSSSDLDRICQVLSTPGGDKADRNGKVVPPKEGHASAPTKGGVADATSKSAADKRLDTVGKVEGTLKETLAANKAENTKGKVVDEPGKVVDEPSLNDDIQDKVEGATGQTGSTLRCNLKYNARGSVVGAPSTSLQYDMRELATRIQRNGNTVQYRHGPDGVMEMRETDANGNTTRHELRYGPRIARIQLADGSRVYQREISGPGGLALVQRGPREPDENETSTRVYVHGSGVGNRMFTDAQGAVTQFVRYDAFGGVQSDSGSPEQASYSFDQWNGGDALTSVGLNQLGARIYEPAWGRFLQRDPVVRLRHASRTHPYAFAGSDPVNSADPTGLDESLGDHVIDPSTLVTHESGQMDAVSMNGRYNFHWVPGATSWLRYKAEVIYVHDPAPPVNIVVVDDSDHVGFIGALATADDLHDFANVEGMVDDILARAGDSPIADLRFDAHAAPGSHWLHKDSGEDMVLGRTKPEIDRQLARLIPKLKGGQVTLGGCRPAAGIRGAAFLQERADFFGVPVRGSTGAQNALVPGIDGVWVTRHPGQAFDPVEVLVDQIERQLADNRIRLAHRDTPTKLIINRLKEAQHAGLLDDVLVRLTANGAFGKLVDHLNQDAWSASTARQINSIGIPGVSAGSPLPMDPH